MFGSLAEIFVQVCFLGIRLFSLNTGLVKTMLKSNVTAAGASPSLAT